ncbi:hypothetical protein [Sphingopyxis terrae]|uniref:hypothetical protein n=1 Tax=Sphingopyxis terrae TaxID=33052 RepID=UPI0010551606|nr:hypothetical protein [Sphingopyxis terrae]
MAVTKAVRSTPITPSLSLTTATPGIWDSGSSRADEDGIGADQMRALPIELSGNNTSINSTIVLVPATTRLKR